MIGTGDGQQYEDQFSHALSTIGIGGSTEPTGELKTDLGSSGTPAIANPPLPREKPVIGAGIDRSSFQAELDKNPNLIPKMASMVKGEVGMRSNNLEHQQIQLETAFNRAQARGHSLEQALLSVSEDPKRGYYAGGPHGTYGRPATPAEVEAFRTNVLDPVMKGSNLSDRGFGPMTGNASAGVARHQFARGTPGYTFQGESYFNEEKGQHLANLQNLPRLPGTAAQLTVNPVVDKVLQQPHIQDILNDPKIDRSHNVPYIAGASKDPNDFTTHVDKHIPTSVTISGKTFDPAIPLAIHEQVEREVMNNLIKRGMSDNKAYEIAHHEYAEPAEDAWYKANDIDVDEMNKWWDKQDKVTEEEKEDLPPTLYTKPYPHNEVEGVKHEPSNVNAEWATTTKVAMNEHFKPFNPMQPAYSNPGGHEKNIPETIYSAAIRDRSGAVHMGMNHSDAWMQAIEAGRMNITHGLPDADQGYITSKGRFVDRQEANKIAKEQKQKQIDFESKHGLLSEELDSETKESVLQALKNAFK